MPHTERITRAKSLGHIAFVPDTHGSYWEYWERDGQIWRQSVTAPVMPDGYRSGRWYSRATEPYIEGLRAFTRAGY